MNKTMSFMELAEEKKDLDDFIREVVLKISPSKKQRVADILLGAAICSSEETRPPDGRRVS